MWFLVVLSWCVLGLLWTANGKRLPQLSPQAALDFDLYFNCSEVGITHTPNLVKIFDYFSAMKVWPVVLVVFGF
jgi:hypothetical protein